MAKISLVFTDIEGPVGNRCEVHVTSDPDVDVMAMKLVEMSPAQTALFSCIDAIKQLKRLSELQVDHESVYSHEPGFVPLEFDSDDEINLH